MAKALFNRAPNRYVKCSSIILSATEPRAYGYGSDAATLRLLVGSQSTVRRKLQPRQQEIAQWLLGVVATRSQFAPRVDDGLRVCALGVIVPYLLIT